MGGGGALDVLRPHPRCCHRRRHRNRRYRPTAVAAALPRVGAAAATVGAALASTASAAADAGRRRARVRHDFAPPSTAAPGVVCLGLCIGSRMVVCLSLENFDCCSSQKQRGSLVRLIGPDSGRLDWGLSSCSQNDHTSVASFPPCWSTTPGAGHSAPAGAAHKSHRSGRRRGARARRASNPAPCAAGAGGGKSCGGGERAPSACRLLVALWLGRR